ncbi:MAG: N-6 DNA methylase [Anaerolineales bacterium]|nr:N-6 DNA methylase [Anaerolineales bacterium]
MAFTFDQSKDEIARLIKHFSAHRAAYQASGYKEAHVRQEFIDPLFMALNWDVRNQQQAAPEYREVVVEDSLDMGRNEAHRAPDYVFRVGRERKFFAEAKKPGVDIKTSLSPAYQLRRYAWSAKLPLSVLTDFQEWSAYDCRIRPSDKDKSSTARLNYITYEEYPDRWHEVWDVFSREAVRSGSFDAFAQAGRGRRGTSEVDAEFLKEIEGWRNALARNIALRNPDLTIDELNDAVQRTIDRIIFLRMAEDRGVEPYGRLQKLAEGDEIYAGLIAMCRQADSRYNSGLFDFSKTGDSVTPDLVLDDKALEPILADLYFPKSPYAFNVLPVEILGNVYEQFLGKVIRLTAGHQAKVEEKPEVKKAGGVYYTPAYIVEYIVKNAVGKQVEGKSPKQLKGFRVLDMACGSGSFLLGAYQYLMDHYLGWYTANEPEKNKNAVWKYRDTWKLTTAEKKRILTEHIFGVDIDRQAAEVTKLSLLIKVLEGESDESLSRQRQMELLPERALPNLDKNIKCGNSLIGPDYFAGRLMPDPEELRRVNPFDWAAEFPEAMQAGGFDCVIGNPPYGADYTEKEKEYFQGQFIYRKGKPETYIFFFERGFNLLKSSGCLGYITPNAWLTNHYGAQLRRYLLSKGFFYHLVDLEPTKVFQKAIVDTVISIITNRKKLDDASLTSISKGTKDHRIEYKFTISQSIWKDDKQSIINLQANPIEISLLTKMNCDGGTLGDLVDYSQGVIPYKTKEDGEANRYIAEKPRGLGWYPLLESASQLRRFEIDAPTAYIHYGNWLWCPRDPKYFKQPKILFHRLRKKLPRQLIGACDFSGAVNRHSLSNLILQPELPIESLFAVLGLFNSTLANWWFVKKYGLLMEVGGFKISELPLPLNWMQDQEKMIVIVKQMIDIHKQKKVAKDIIEEERLQRLIDSTDSQIDALVYELYELTSEEIAIVEGSQ